MVKNCQQLQISDLIELLPDQWFTMVSISCQTNSSIYGLSTKSFANKTLEMPKQMFHFRKRTFFSSTRIISSPKVCFQMFLKDPCHKKAKRMVSETRQRWPCHRDRLQAPSHSLCFQQTFKSATTAMAWRLHGLVDLNEITDYTPKISPKCWDWLLNWPFWPISISIFVAVFSCL